MNSSVLSQLSLVLFISHIDMQMLRGELLDRDHHNDFDVILRICIYNSCFRKHPEPDK
jgi:hypothetical protein